MENQQSPENYLEKTPNELKAEIENLRKKNRILSEGVITAIANLRAEHHRNKKGEITPDFALLTGRYIHENKLISQGRDRKTAEDISDKYFNGE